MAYEGQQITLPGMLSGEDLSASTCAFKLVKWDTVTGAPYVVLCDAETDVACGVLQAPTPTAAEGQPVQVVAVGVTKIQGDGTVTVGETFGPSTTGTAHKCVYVTDKTKYIHGYILNREAAGSAGMLLTAVVNCINPMKAVQSA
jgi:hypothetical protein